MSDNTTEVEDFDVKYWLFKILGFWYLFVLAIVASTGGAYLYLRYTEKTYRVSSSVLVADESSSNDLGLEALTGLSGGRRSFGSSSLEAEISVIKSFDLIQSTLKNLNFQVSYFSRGDIKDSEIFGREPIAVKALDFEDQTRSGIFFDFNGKTSFNVYLDGEEKRWQCDFGKPCVSESFAFVATVKDESKPVGQSELLYMKIHDLDRLTVQYINMLNVNNRQAGPLARFGSDIIDIDIAGKIITKNTTFLNAIIEAFIKYDLEERNSTANRTINFIDTQLGTITDSLARVENGLENYRAQKGIIDLSSKGELLLNELTNLESQRAGIDLSIKYYDFLSDYLVSAHKSDGIVSPSTVGIIDPTLISLIGELNLLLTQRVKLSVTEGDSSIVLKGIDDQVKNVRERTHESIRNAMESSKISYDQIDDQLEKLKAQVSELPKNERELLRIQRKFNINNELYTFLLKKKSETEIARAGNKSKVKVLDEARDLQARLLGPQPKKIYLQANAVGLFLILAVLGARFFFQNKILEIEQIKLKGNVTILGRIPHVNAKSRKKKTALISPKDPFSEAFRGLKLNLDFVIPKKTTAKIVGVTSAESGEGKTFGSLNLAQAFAVSGKKTLLVGLDMRKPKIQEELTLSNTLGLSNYLVGNAQTKEIIQASEIEGLDVIASGPVPPNPAELIGGSRFSELMQELDKDYDYIVCDGPPMGLVTDYLSVVPFVDTTLFVVRLKYSQLKATQLLLEHTSRGVIQSAHILINDVGENASKRYGYGYGYGEDTKKRGFLARVFQR